MVKHAQRFKGILRRVNANTELTLNLLTTTIVAPPSNASKWQMGFNSAFKGLNHLNSTRFTTIYNHNDIKPNWLTQWAIIVRDKSTGAQIAKESPPQPSVLRNVKGCEPCLGADHSVHITQNSLLKIHFNITLRSHLGLPSNPFPSVLRLFVVHFSTFTCAEHSTHFIHPAHDRPSNVWWEYKFWQIFYVL